MTDASLKDLLSQLSGGFAAAKQTFIGAILIVVGVIAAIAGTLLGAVQKK